MVVRPVTNPSKPVKALKLRKGRGRPCASPVTNPSKPVKALKRLGECFSSSFAYCHKPLKACEGSETLQARFRCALLILVTNPSKPVKALKLVGLNDVTGSPQLLSQTPQSL